MLKNPIEVDLVDVTDREELVEAVRQLHRTGRWKDAIKLTKRDGVADNSGLPRVLMSLEKCLNQHGRVHEMIRCVQSEGNEGSMQDLIELCSKDEVVKAYRQRYWPLEAPTPWKRGLKAIAGHWWAEYLGWRWVYFEAPRPLNRGTLTEGFVFSDDFNERIIEQLEKKRPR